MKKKVIKTIILILMAISITGCSKANYQKDESYETDIIGTYEINAEADSDNKTTYYKQYVLNDDNTYNYESNVFGTDSKSSGNYTINSETENILIIDFDIINSTSTDEELVNIKSAKQYKKVYKYKNMLGSIIEMKELPTSETFNYIIPDETGGGMMFTKDGYYHACIDINNCQCDYAKDVKYIRKNNVIYFNIKNSVSDDYWQITNYVVDDYLFTPELYKVEEQ
jgi:hypothetical protein